MPGLSAKVGIAASALLVLLATSAPAWAQYPRDRAARAKIDEALERYLNTEFDSAEALLTGTIRACEERCRPETVARAWMYVGVVRGSGKSQQAQALAAFNQALDTDPSAELDSELATPETASTWQLALEGRPPRESRAPAKPAKTSDPPDLFKDPDAAEVCPPGLPGCVAAHGRCLETSECQAGLVCSRPGEGPRGSCEAPASCHGDDECEDGVCQHGACVSAPEHHPRRHWIGLHTALDIVHAPTSAQACQAPYHCFQGADALDASVPASGVAGGFLRGTTRVLASYEYRLSQRWFLGARAGLAFGGAPSGFLPLHAELRAGARFSGPRWLSTRLQVGAGVAELSARLPVSVGAAGDSADAYGAFGRTFVSAGGGGTLLFSEGFGLDVELSGLFLFPDQAWALQPALGLVVAL